MSSHLHGIDLIRRVIAEHRRAVTWLAAALVANVAVYAAVVYPLAERVANVEERERMAEQALAEARSEHDAARNTLVGKERASTELVTFYEQVLPADFSAARRLTHVRIPQLALESGLRLTSTSTEQVDERGSSFSRMKTEAVLRGSYDGMRTFIYQLETAPEFVVIDDVTLAEGSDDRGALLLTLQLSTYYRQPER